MAQPSILFEENKCNDNCEHADDGKCDDGGPRAKTLKCDLGSDCTDCGERRIKYMIYDELRDLENLKKRYCTHEHQCEAMYDVSIKEKAGRGVQPPIQYDPMVYNDLTESEKNLLIESNSFGWPVKWKLRDHSTSPWGYNMWVDNPPNLKYRISDTPDKCTFAGELKPEWTRVMSHNEMKSSSFRSIVQSCTEANHELSRFVNITNDPKENAEAFEAFDSNYALYCVYDSNKQSLHLTHSLSPKDHQMVCSTECDKTCRLINDVHTYCNDKWFVKRDDANGYEEIQRDKRKRRRLCNILPTESWFPKRMCRF